VEDTGIAVTRKIWIVVALVENTKAKKQLSQKTAIEN